ncbi:MAG: type III-B CRISPR module-associated protein Cmr3 [Candidatus Ratteibacteria bacterium]
MSDKSKNSMIKFKFNPFDVLYFGGGKPFNLSVQEASSIFPPFPNTLASAICSKIYFEKGINVSKIIRKFYGPFLEKEGKILLPKPLDILCEIKKKDGEICGVDLKDKFKLINPAYTDCQGLKALLWENKRNKHFEVFESFITIDGLKKWLNNQEIKKEDLVFKGDIFEFEPRIGIKMDNSRNVTKEEDALYRIDFVRFKEGINLIFYVEFNFDDEELKNTGLDDLDKIYDLFNNTIKVLKLGGEMRSIRYECERVEKSIEEILEIRKPQIKNNDVIKILYLTPGITPFISEENFSFLEFLSVVIKSTNLVMKSKNCGNGKILRRGIVAGSVIYAKVKDGNKLNEIWLNPKDGEFIGCDLRIYTKI